MVAEWSSWLMWFTPFFKLADPFLNPTWGRLYVEKIWLKRKYGPAININFSGRVIKHKCKIWITKVIIRLWPINGQKNKYFGSTRLNSTSYCLIPPKYRYSTWGRVKYRTTIRPTIRIQVMANIKFFLNIETRLSYLPKFALYKW